ncbi:hypothetical protein R3W88_016924 [Solanum pinnatisectum]|uniref:Uncharacterized protein n=1 Tax=Solanum pinnatisectum TaxID=50273 RepID=A0AAV9KYP6_9SOLN|nr:hypothetical protein R3W88_016924 [Solanum pinnatisectum]
MKRMRDNNKDFDFVTESPFSQSSPLSRVEESPNHGVLMPREVRVSFNENLADNGSIRRRSDLSTGPGLQDEVVLNTNSSFRRKSHLLAATRTKSRLMDPPEQDQRSQKITMKSGILGRSTEFEDDDPFSD